MSIAHKDFFPQVVKSGLLSDQIETIAEVVSRTNDWIAENKVQVLNVETIMLPLSYP
jgi:hypothetical protein